MTTRSITLKFLTIFCLVVSGSICHSQIIDQAQISYKNKSQASQIEKATNLIKELMTDKHIPGLSICVATRNSVIWAEGFGYADLENNTPVTINSKFRIGSISKTLTALALSKLIENNKISLSDPISKYVNYFPDKNYSITIRNLASHSSGIRDYNYKKREFVSNQRFNSVKESVNIFKDDSLLFIPGTKYSYSTYGYVLLSAAIENASEKDFLAYIHDDIFVPMGLSNTVPDYNDSIIPFRVRFYDEAKGKIINGFHVDNSNKWAGGGFLSTPYDLAKMAQGLLNNKFLKKSTVDNLWTPSVLLNGQKTNYGIGWKIDSDSSSRKYVYHGGSSVGGRSFLMVYPKEELIIAISCNLTTNFDQEFVLKIVECFL